MERRPLWAPWRLEYVTSPRREGCIFCAHGAAEGTGRAPGLVVQRGERCFTMLNAFPYASGHVMVSPYRHVGALDALEQPELVELMTLARESVAALRRLMRADGFNVGLNIGEVAGAGYKDHLHLHVVPRWQGDTNFMPVLANTAVIPQALEDTARALERALADTG